MKAKTKLEKSKITYDHFMIRGAACRGGEYANPGKERIEKILEMIMNSHISIIEEFEYSYHPIEEDLTERKQVSKGVFKEGSMKINYDKTVFSGHRKITFHIQQIFREGRAIIELLDDSERKKLDDVILDNLIKDREKKDKLKNKGGEKE